VFKTILYPTDFSDVARKALDFIKQLRHSGAQEIVILHVVDERLVVPPEMLEFIGTEEEEAPISGTDLSSVFPSQRGLGREIEARLRTIEDELQGLGFTVESRVVHGVPLREILKLEREEAISVIVMGSHGKSNVEEMLLGSVSEKVVRKCRSPILIIKR
jgi:nucleotide-binding universal stress UspA family protein